MCYFSGILFGVDISISVSRPMGTRAHSESLTARKRPPGIDAVPPVSLDSPGSNEPTGVA